MFEQVQQQKESFERIYSLDEQSKFDFHITSNQLIRYLRDRRLHKGLNFLKKNHRDITDWSVLVVCGGVGGEGIFFIKNGFKSVTVSDISENSLTTCNLFEPSITTIMLNGESLDLLDNSYDLVVVQDGLHHLPRPVSGFTEMLRVARKAIIVIEPYDSLIGNLIGTEWEIHGDSVNFVFRWNKKMVVQTVKSMLLKKFATIKVIRFWDHGLMVSKIVGKLPKFLQLTCAKAIYALLSTLNVAGNMMVAVVVK